MTPKDIITLIEAAELQGWEDGYDEGYEEGVIAALQNPSEAERHLEELAAEDAWNQMTSDSSPY